MASGPITSRQIEREKEEAVTDFLFLGSKITADSDCSHEIRRWWLLGRKAKTNLDTVFKRKDITLLTKVHVLKVFYSRELDHKEGWVLKNWCFQIVVLEKTLESPLDCKEIQPVHPKGKQYSIFIESSNSNILAIWWEELTHLKRPWCWERLKAGGEGADKGWDGWMASPTWWTWVWVNSGNWKWTGRPGVLQFMGSQRARHDWVTELNWTESIIIWIHLLIGWQV